MNYQAEKFILQNKGNFCTVLEDVHNIWSIAFFIQKTSPINTHLYVDNSPVATV